MIIKQQVVIFIIIGTHVTAHTIILFIMSIRQKKMTKYLQPTPFTVNNPVATPEFRKGWDATFGKKYCAVCGKDGIDRDEEIVLCADCEERLTKELENYEFGLAVGRDPKTPFYDEVLKLSQKANEK
jgi:hypothetical protein